MSPQAEMRIGTGPRDYNSYRSFERVPVPGVRFIREPYFPIRRLGRFCPKLRHISKGVGLFFPTGRVALYHSFNAVILNRSPWVVTFECQLPRVWNAPRVTNFLMSKLASDSCRRVIAMSENARKHLVHRNQNHPMLPQVLGKTVVIPPSVEDDGEALRVRRTRDPAPPFHIGFIGNEFFRKGGDLAVEAYERLKASYPLRMTVVSSLFETNDAYPVEKGEGLRWKERIRQSGAEFRQQLAPSEVRRLLASCDVLLLPTLEDSFGYSTVEAMATGVAVVATAVEALPEIVKEGETGLLMCPRRKRDESYGPLKSVSGSSSSWFRSSQCCSMIQRVCGEWASWVVSVTKSSFTPT
jgi:glycosyltransferase involved in cell wall biosynthesis